MKKHSDFSPSSFERRVLCPASYMMEKDLPSIKSKYADEGTLLHELATTTIKDFLENHCLSISSGYSCNTAPDFVENIAFENANVDLLKNVFKSFLHVVNSNAFSSFNVILDEKFKLEYLGDNEVGTVDCVITGNNEEGRHQIHVIDFKFGYGVKVEAYMNYQLLNYAKGYIRSKYHIIEDYDLHLHIFQPTFLNSCWSLDEEEKLKWVIGDSFYKDVINKCKKLEPEFNPSVKACKFCKAKSICKPLSTNIIIKDKYTLTTDEIKEFLDKKELIMLYINSLEDYAKSILENGGHINGYSLADKYSNRKWKSDAEYQLESMLGEGAYNIKKTIIGVLQAEKLLGKEQVDKLTEKEHLGKVIIAKEDKLKNIN
jgi:hypothetical protein